MKGASTGSKQTGVELRTGSSSYRRIIRAFAQEYEQITAMVQVSLHALPIATSNASSCSTTVLLFFVQPSMGALSHRRPHLSLLLLQHTHLSTISAALGWQSRCLPLGDACHLTVNTRTKLFVLAGEQNGWTAEQSRRTPSSRQQNIATMWNALLGDHFLLYKHRTIKCLYTQ